MSSTEIWYHMRLSTCLSAWRWLQLSQLSFVSTCSTLFYAYSNGFRSGLYAYQSMFWYGSSLGIQWHIWPCVVLHCHALRRIRHRCRSSMARHTGQGWLRCTVRRLGDSHLELATTYDPLKKCFPRPWLTHFQMAVLPSDCNAHASR